MAISVKDAIWVLNSLTFYHGGQILCNHTESTIDGCFIQIQMKIHIRGISMELTITVSDDEKLALEQRVRERGFTDAKQYIERLIHTDLLAAKSFDEILAPIRKTFQESDMSEDELEKLFEEAREEVYQERKAKEQ
jgi:hypothetical protein